MTTSVFDVLSGLLSPDQMAAAIAKLQQNSADSPEPEPTKTTKTRKRRELPKNFSQHEIELFFKAIDNPRDTAIFRLMYHRGLRASEIGMLQLSSVDMRDERITFTRLKGSKGGTYRLTSNELRALRAWLRIRGSDPGVLFPSREGKPISQQRLDQLVKKYGTRAGLPAEKLHCHTLKHSCGTHLRMKGENLEDIQDHLGHRNIENTRIYVDFGGDIREARDKRLRNW